MINRQRMEQRAPEAKRSSKKRSEEKPRLAKTKESRFSRTRSRTYLSHLTSLTYLLLKQNSLKSNHFIFSFF